MVFSTSVLLASTELNSGDVSADGVITDTIFEDSELLLIYSYKYKEDNTISYDKKCVTLCKCFNY